MPCLYDVTSKIPVPHKAALTWFIERRGQEIAWPEKISEGTFLVNRAKGIHKPANWRYALSARQVLDSPYADSEPVVQQDGSWKYLYFQEETKGSQPSGLFTNSGMLACIEDGIPIGVLRQTSKKPAVRYMVMGLAWLTECAATDTSF